jgi:hypothetical protein
MHMIAYCFADVEGYSKARFLHQATAAQMGRLSTQGLGQLGLWQNQKRTDSAHIGGLCTTANVILV